MGRGSVSLKKMDQNRDFGVTQNNEHRIKIYSILIVHFFPSKSFQPLLTPFSRPLTSFVINVVHPPPGTLYFFERVSHRFRVHFLNRFHVHSHLFYFKRVHSLFHFERAHVHPLFQLRTTFLV